MLRHPSMVAPRSSTADDGGGAPGRPDLVDVVVAAPRFGQVSWEPVVQAAVDLGAAADAAALDVRDDRVAERTLRPAVAVFADHLAQREGLVGVGVDPRALLDDRDL